MFTLGILREYKEPPDRRVAFSPAQCRTIVETYPGAKLIVEPSPHRIFSDDAYREAGITVSSDLSECDILFGIKEVPANRLIPNKTYLFFSHTIKLQPHNRDLFKAIVKNGIRLIDYECLKWPVGSRVLGFGRYAGIVGTYEAFKAIGIRKGLYQLPATYTCNDYLHLKEELQKVLPIIKSQNLRIVITGSGRVAHGCEELMGFMQIEQVTPEAYLNSTFNETVYTLLDSHHLYERKDGEPWNHEHFFKNHAMYRSIFEPYTQCTDLLINGVYWDSAMPPHFTVEQTNSPDFGIRVIADISCDIEGSVPITLRDTTQDEPVMGYNPSTGKECEPYQPGSIDIMAVSNLPTALPADASRSFGDSLLRHVLPRILMPFDDSMIPDATLCENGQLTPPFQYMKDYLL